MWNMFKKQKKEPEKQDNLDKDIDMEEKRLFLEKLTLSDANERAKNELLNYLKEDFKRFYITFSLLPDKEKKQNVFEIGANPYYLTALMLNYTNFKVECSNCFDDSDLSFYRDHQTLIGEDQYKIDIPYINLNIEKNWYNPNSLSNDITEGFFDIICFCEVIEHLIESPVRALLHINKMLKINGTLILSTPNVNRMENVARMISGANLYDPFSGYGSYGRHNREYNKHELYQLLNLCGFEVETMFSENVHEERAKNYYPVDKIQPLLDAIPNRNFDLGQYLFFKAHKIGNVECVDAPEWLYRSISSPIITSGSCVGDN